MRFCHWGKDGGPESTVWGFWLVELKCLFSIVLLRFEDGSRAAYHEHAFSCVSWVLRGGGLMERFLSRLLDYQWGRAPRFHRPSWRPVVTRRTDFHQVESIGRTWVLSFRGPWAQTWREWTRAKGYRTLTHGRKAVA